MTDKGKVSYATIHPRHRSEEPLLREESNDSWSTLGEAAITLDDTAVSEWLAVAELYSEATEIDTARRLTEVVGPTRRDLLRDVGSLVLDVTYDKAPTTLQSALRNPDELRTEAASREAQLEHYATLRRAELNRVRQRVSTLGPSEAVRLQAYMDHNASPYLLAIKEQQAASGDWREWIGKQATDEELLNIFQWHIDQLRQQADHPDTERAVLRQRTEFKAAVIDLIRSGDLSERAAGAVS